MEGINLTAGVATKHSVADWEASLQLHLIAVNSMMRKCSDHAQNRCVRHRKLMWVWQGREGSYSGRATVASSWACHVVTAGVTRMTQCICGAPCVTPCKLRWEVSRATVQQAATWLGGPPGWPCPLVPPRPHGLNALFNYFLQNKCNIILFHMFSLSNETKSVLICDLAIVRSFC